MTNLRNFQLHRSCANWLVMKPGLAASSKDIGNLLDDNIKEKLHSFIRRWRKIKKLCGCRTMKNAISFKRYFEPVKIQFNINLFISKIVCNTIVFI